MARFDATRYIESREVFGMRFGLERMDRLLAQLGRPERCAPAIHVVGTNGKSSTTRFAAAILTAHGRRVGSYISPHVDGWHERVMIDGEPIGASQFAHAVGQVANCIEHPTADPDEVVTQFEVLTASALLAFAEAGVEVLVVEAGLGGRFDATNVFQGEATVALTSIAREHTQLLGDTERQIAGEKLAVARDGWDRIVVGPLSPQADGPVRQICAKRDLHPWFVGDQVVVSQVEGRRFTVTTPGGWYERIELRAPGAFQIANAATAIAAVEQLLEAPPDVEAVRGALARVRVPGRLEIIDGTPMLVLDGAHNPEAMAALVDALPNVLAGRPAVAVVSIFADKDIAAMAATLAPAIGKVVVTKTRNARAADTQSIATAFGDVGVDVSVVADSWQALALARDIAGPAGAVVVCGSLALLAELRTVALQAWSGDPGMLARGNAPEIVRKPER